MLSSRERCLRAIALEEPDRVPLILRIRPEPLEALKRYLQISDEEKIHRALGIDIRSVGIGLKGGYAVEGAEDMGDGCAYIGTREGWKVGRHIFGYETIWAPDHTYTYTFIHHPLQHMSIEEYVWPEIDETSIPNAEESCRKFEDYCVYGGVTHMFEEAWKLTGFDEFLIAMYKNPPFIEKILDKLNQLRTEQAIILAEMGVDAVVDGDDVGTQGSMMMSPALWRRYLKPRYAKMIKEIKRRGAKAHFHSDGWIEPIIPDLIEIGVDILNPVQPESMDPAKIKGLYGDRLCFDGTISIQRTMPHGTPEDVAKEVKERIRTLGPTGLILGPSHDMQPDVPIKNILTLYETAKKYGRNPKMA